MKVPIDYRPTSTKGWSRVIVALLSFRSRRRSRHRRGVGGGWLKRL